ncbi:MAG: SLC13 family permease [Prevotellaceae bacterium]|nr:SLC13 family permease [Prevotellaceae bacterium]
MLWGLSFFGWLTVAVIITKAVLMIKTRLPGDIIGLGIIVFLLLVGALPTEMALSCFSSTSVVLVGALFVLATALVHSGLVHWMTSHLLGRPKDLSKALLQIMMPASIMSAFISSAPVMALMLGTVKMWARRRGFMPSKLLLPLSYATTLGGVCTLIGTTPNLVVADIYNSETGQSLGFTSTTLPGLFCLVVGMAIIIALQRLLPVRKCPEETFESSADYTVELVIPADNEHIGETVEDAKLQNVDGGSLVEIVRFDSEIISPVPNDEFLLGNDHLVYSGDINSILQLRNTHGLVNANHIVFNTKDVKERKRKLQMATIDFASPLIGKCMRDISFEDRHGVVLVAVARGGERIKEIPRDIVLRPGDTLLLEGTKLLPEKFSGELNFFDSVALPQDPGKTLGATIILAAMVLLAVTGVMPLLNSCLLATVAMLVIRCLSIEQLQNAINWKLLMVFAGSVCIGKAITHTGVSQAVSDGITLMANTSPLISLVIICTAATFITEFTSSASAAAIFAPIGITIANSLGVNPVTFCVAIMISVSSTFATPMGSETNTFVYGPGGYRFIDYIRIGLPMNIILLIANIFITTIVYPL